MRSLHTPRPNAARSLILTFAGLAVILWLLSQFSTHSVLFPAGPAFEDILVYKGRFTLYHTAKFFTSRAFSAFAYPAGSAPIYEAFYKTSNPVQAYCTLAGTATLSALLAAYTYLGRFQLARLFLPLLVATGFPLIFLIQRANIEIVLWILVALGIVAYRRGLPVVAAVLFGLAATTKLYPIFMLGLFLAPKNRRGRHDLTAFAVGMLTALLGMAWSLQYAGPTFALAAQGFFTGVSRFQDHYVDTVSSVEIAFDHCFFAPVKYWAYTHHASPAPYTHLYFLFAGALALVLFLRVRSMPFLNRVIFLSVAMVALPPVSFSYTLVHLYVPLLLLVGTLAKRQAISRMTLTVLALLLFLMLPLSSLRALAPLPTGLLQSIALLTLFLLSAAIQWPETSGMQVP